MADVWFYDKFGNSKKYDTNRAYVRERNYVVIKSEKQVVCQYDRISGLYSFPDDDAVELNENPTAQFGIISYVWDNGTPVKELQYYSVYVVKDADLENPPFQWCDEEDILVGKINLDKTQFGGFKNLLVRVK